MTFVTNDGERNNPSDYKVKELTDCDRHALNCMPDKMAYAEIKKWR